MLRVVEEGPTVLERRSPLPPEHLALIAKKLNDSYLRQRSAGRSGSGNLIPLNEFSTKRNETCGEASARGSRTVNESLHLIYLTRAS